MVGADPVVGGRWSVVGAGPVLGCCWGGDLLRHGGGGASL